MTDKRLQTTGDADHLQKILGQLGQQASAPRHADLERERAARLATLIDSQLAELIASRRRRRVWTVGVVAVAAAAVIFVSRVDRAARTTAISQEPARSNPTRSEAPPPVRRAPLGLPTAPSVAAPRASYAVSSASVALPSAERSAEPESTLAEENRLFKQAADASRDSDIPGALAALDRLLQTHPTSPLAQTAVVRKFRLLAKAGRGEEAKQEAERYLLAYPAGFAVREAESLLRRNATPATAVSHPAPQQGL